ncbi:L-serine ammonia-lyase, iron-sulfur-dependent subunit beta [Hespellia stercorisuis]|uniref:L-serine deaminase n=1 Tax=Hespellia stercorisuis DSM 15480 TaxID=1121950 RepID=A0A1M6MLP3_9FIRM|nr:L-serine ammonia-lyase, iron-sulfur-dependent subunit beta [Hespellia stercorisuis]SHJ84415.1 L-serine ammonia-lyase [Hespellia stercorisuis DSM 15480]
MNFISLFDVIGPNMIGPSSSHTAGAVAIALLARKMFQEEVRKVTFTLYESFAKTYRGHGTDRALLGGTLGFSPDDRRIPDAFQIADELGVAYSFVADEETKTNHPNTVDILLENGEGHTLSVRGESIGGGKIKIVRINGIDVEFTGEYSTLIVKHTDKPGVIAYVTQCLSECAVNIAFMRVFREEKGAVAYAVVESDEEITDHVLEKIGKNQWIEEHMLIQM